MKRIMNSLWLISFTTSAFAYYMPEQGRWPNRDPIEEKGGIMSYSYVSNDSINSYDLYGLLTVRRHEGDPNVVPNISGAEQGRTESIPTQSGSIVSCGSGKRKFTGYSLEVDITITYFADPNDLVAAGGRTIRDHEETHATIHLEYFNAYDKQMLWLNERCLCIPCFNASYDYVNKAAEYLFQVSEYKSLSLDCQDYMPGSYEKDAKCTWASRMPSLLVMLKKAADDARLNLSKVCK